MKDTNTEQHPIYQRVLILIPVIFCIYGLFEAGNYFIDAPTIEGAVIMFLLANVAVGLGLIAVPIKNGDRYLRYSTGAMLLVELVIWFTHFLAR